MRDDLAGELADVILEGGAMSPKMLADRLMARPLAPLLSEAAHLRAENANLRDRVREVEKGVEMMREACLKAAISASYGPPSSWPGPYPKGWKHPPCWEPGQKPTPDQAAWHDNGARDAWFAIRALAGPPVGLNEKGGTGAA
ncbi:hypothetical protein ME121_3683 [Methylobacterium sp. ME121]|nr:hypothetical protein ME121_3683 [Methylobacterium sp. ME121]